MWRLVDEAKRVEEVVREPEEEVGGDDREGSYEDAGTKLPSPQRRSGGRFSEAQGSEVHVSRFGIETASPEIIFIIFLRNWGRQERTWQFRSKLLFAFRQYFAKMLYPPTNNQSFASIFEGTAISRFSRHLCSRATSDSMMARPQHSSQFFRSRHCRKSDIRL